MKRTEGVNNTNRGVVWFTVAPPALLPLLPLLLLPPLPLLLLGWARPSSCWVIGSHSPRGACQKP
jgi:hypothetical protein